jgi:hypothetical protein
MSEQQELEVKKYIYQPTDEDGRPIGGKQVLEYTTHEELADKLREQNVLLIRKLRQETRKVRLGIVDDEEISADTPRFQGFTDFHPRDLSDEERYDLARKLQDPTTAFEAVNTIVEAQVGAPLSDIGAKLSAGERENLSLRAKIEANAFVNDNPDYYKCQENFEAITSWMVRYDLAPIKANYQKAYDTLKAQGVLILGAAPTPVATPVAEAAPVVEPVVVEQAPPVYPRIASGLNNDNSSSVGPIIPTGSDIVYEVISNGQKRILTGLQAIKAMPSEEYKKRLLQDKEFGKKVDRLEAEARKPRV